MSAYPVLPTRWQPRTLAAMSMPSLGVVVVKRNYYQLHCFPASSTTYLCFCSFVCRPKDIGTDVGECDSAASSSKSLELSPCHLQSLMQV